MNVEQALVRLQKATDKNGQLVDPELRNRIVSAYEDCFVDEYEGFEVSITINTPKSEKAQRKKLRKLGEYARSTFQTELPQDFCAFFQHVHTLEVSVVPTDMDDVDEIAGGITMYLQEILDSLDDYARWPIIPFADNGYHEPISLVFGCGDPFMAKAHKDNFDIEDGWRRDFDRGKSFSEWFNQWIETGLYL